MKENTAYYHFLPYLIIFFLFNNFMLPHGLLYTTILSPVFIYWLYKIHVFRQFVIGLILFLIPIPFQLFNDAIDLKVYFVSTCLILTAYTFLIAAIHTVKRINADIEKLYKSVLIINGILILIALLILPFDSINDLMWYFIPISAGVPIFPRLMLLAYEPSHYSLLLSPIFIYFTLKLLNGKSNHPFLIFLAIAAPLGLSMSFGVIATLLLAISFTIIVYHKSFPKKLWANGFKLGLFMLFVLGIIFLIWPHNPIFTRIVNIITGNDTSANGRLFESFMFAKDLIVNYNIFFGIGVGQIKILAHDFIISFYNYTGEFAKTVRIPNSMAEMLATYGIYGFVLKLFFEIYFFIKLKIYNNYYSFCLFLFIFIYQFTGSFLVNIAEIGIWAIVFNAKVTLFNSSNYKLKADE